LYYIIIVCNTSSHLFNPACDFIVAHCDFDAACDKQTWLPAIRMALRQSRSVRLWSRTLRHCRA